VFRSWRPSLLEKDISIPRDESNFAAGFPDFGSPRAFSSRLIRIPYKGPPTVDAMGRPKKQTPASNAWKER
jgi:hypothetical protein